MPGPELAVLTPEQQRQLKEQQKQEQNIKLYQKALSEVKSTNENIMQKLDKIQGRQNEIIGALKTSGASIPQPTIKTMATEYFDLEKQKKKHFEELDNAWTTFQKEAKKFGFEAKPQFTSKDLSEVKYSVRENIFNIIEDIGQKQSPGLQAMRSEVNQSLSRLNELPREANKIRDKYGVIIPSEKFEVAKAEMDEIKKDFESVLSNYQNSMKKQEEMYRELYGLPHLFGEEYIQRQVKIVRDEFGLRSFITTG